MNERYPICIGCKLLLAFYLRCLQKMDKCFKMELIVYAVACTEILLGGGGAFFQKVLKFLLTFL